MAEIHFTSHLRNLVPDGPIAASGATVGEALDNLVAGQPHVRGYVLDDQGRLRKHVCIFADGERLAWMHANFTDGARVAALGGADSYATRLFDYEHTGRDQVAWVVDRLRRSRGRAILRTGKISPSKSCSALRRVTAWVAFSLPWTWPGLSPSARRRRFIWGCFPIPFCAMRNSPHSRWCNNLHRLELPHLAGFPPPLENFSSCLFSVEIIKNRI